MDSKRILADQITTQVKTTVKTLVRDVSRHRTALNRFSHRMAVAVEHHGLRTELIAITIMLVVGAAIAFPVIRLTKYGSDLSSTESILGYVFLSMALTLFCALLVLPGLVGFIFDSDDQEHSLALNVLIAFQNLGIGRLKTRLKKFVVSYNDQQLSHARRILATLGGEDAASPEPWQEEPFTDSIRDFVMAHRELTIWRINSEIRIPKSGPLPFLNRIKLDFSSVILEDQGESLPLCSIIERISKKSGMEISKDDRTAFNHILTSATKATGQPVKVDSVDIALDPKEFRQPS